MVKTVTHLQDQVIIEIPFNGKGLTYVVKGEIQFSDAKTFEQLQAMFPEKILKAISQQEYRELMSDYYTKKLSSVPKAEYERARQDSIRLTKIKPSFTLFFSAKPVKGTFHDIYVFDSKTEKHFRGCKNITLSDIEIFQEIVRDLSL